ncbi:MAG: hypothetical protein AAF560_08185 [Acidobacteriota bacterium]
MSSINSRPVHKWSLRIAAVLWVIWGAVHILAGVMVVPAEPLVAITSILDAVDPASLTAEYPAELSGILSQHGFNLGWFGVATVIGAVFIWRGNATAIWVTGLIGGLADLGYFMFIDLPGYARFIPGTLMTYVSGSAILLSFWVWLSNRGASTAKDKT